MKYNLKWDAPTTNADGTPLTDLGGYNLYMGGVKVKDVGNATTCEIDVPEGSFKYTMRAYDKAGNESVDSEAIMFEVVICPGPVTNFTAEKVG